MEEQLTQERIAKHYLACLDSVQVINDVVANSEKYKDDDTILERNVKHLQGMRQASFWTTEDMTPLEAAIALGSVT